MTTGRSSTFALVRMAVLASLGSSDALRRVLRSEAARGIPTRKILEALLEVHLFAGFPASIDALIVLRTIRPQRGGGTEPRTGRTSGNALIRKVYGKNYHRLMLRMKNLDRDFSSWIVRYGYGTVLSRGGLSLRERELIAIGSLAALGWERQLRSHVMSAVRLGTKKEEIGRVLRIVSKERRTRRKIKLAAQSLLDRSGA